jgi:hypothetical protein
MKNAIAMLKLFSFAQEDIKENRLYSQEEVFKEVEELLKNA